MTLGVERLREFSLKRFFSEISFLVKKIFMKKVFIITSVTTVMIYFFWRLHDFFCGEVA